MFINVYIYISLSIYRDIYIYTHTYMYGWMDGCAYKKQKQNYAISKIHRHVLVLLARIFYFCTSWVCDDTDKTVVTKMSGLGGKIEQEIMYFN